MDASAPATPFQWPAVLVAAVVGGIVALAIGLWVYFGTAVFFEMVRAGIAACF